MVYRDVGATSLKVSIVGFGASPFGDVFQKVDPAEATEAVHFAIDQGINYFDVSPYYGLTKAESRLGEALLGKREKVVLSTKCGRYGADEFDFSASRIRAGLEQSLKRLKTDHVDLLYAHDVEFGSTTQIVEETLPCMRALQQEGKTRFIGISGYPIDTLMGIAEAAPVDAILNYCHYNLLVDVMDETLTPFAQQHRIGLINASALHMGLLTESDSPAWHPAPLEVRNAARRVVELCRSRGVSAPETAIQFCLQYKKVASTLIGIASRREVEACLRSMHSPVSQELLAEIRSAIGPAFNYVWASADTIG